MQREIFLINRTVNRIFTRLIGKPSVDYVGKGTATILIGSKNDTKKEGANDCHYSSLQAPQGPCHENKTMSAPLYVEGRFHYLTW